MGRAEYHSRPSQHFVFDAATWEEMKAKFGSHDARDDRSIAGQTGQFRATPVYLDGCPWDCSEADESGRSAS